MPDDAKTFRFQVMMTDDEANAVEQWAAENAIRSKAEALRQLCEVGLSAAKKADDVEETALRLENLGKRLAREISGVMARINTAQGDEKERAYQKGLSLLIETTASIVASAEQLSQTATAIVGPVLANRRNLDLEPTLTGAAFSPPEIQAQRSEEEMRNQLKALNALRRREPPKKR